MRPVRSNSCWAPPASAAFGRRGLANRRCLAALPVELAARGVARHLRLDGRGGLADGRALRGRGRPGAFASDAATVGAASFAGSLSSFWISRLETFRCFGAG